MTNRRPGAFFFFKCLGPDDGTGDGGTPVGGAPESAPAPESSTPPVGGGSSGGAPPPPAFDPRSAYEELTGRYAQNAQELAQSRQALSQLYQSVQEGNQRWEGIQSIFKRMAGVEDKPKPEWEGAIAKAREQMQAEMRNFFLEQRVRSELPNLEKEAADLFSAASTPEEKASVRNMLVSLWGNYRDQQGRGHESLSDTVKFINGMVSRVVANKQKEWAAGKTSQQNALKGSGPAGSTPPPPGQRTTSDSKKKGFESLEVSDEDVEQTLAEIRGA
jgi:hypothetical protein